MCASGETRGMGLWGRGADGWLGSRLSPQHEHGVRKVLEDTVPWRVSIVAIARERHQPSPLKTCIPWQREGPWRGLKARGATETG